MPSLSITKRVNAPVETVFAVATDLPNAAQHIRGIEKIELLTAGPIGVGTRWRETRKMMGHESTEILEVTSFDRPRSYAVGCESCGAYIETTFRFVPSGGGTDIALDVRMEARSFFAKLMSPIGKLMFGKMIRKCMDDDLEDVKRVVEMRTANPMTS